MVERRLRADAHEFACADLDHRDAGIIMEMRDDVVGHRIHFAAAVAPHHSGPTAHFIAIRCRDCSNPTDRGTQPTSNRCPAVAKARKLEPGTKTICSHPRMAWLAAGLFALAALFCWPLAFEAQSLLSAEDDPVAIADRGLDRAFDRDVAIHESRPRSTPTTPTWRRASSILPPIAARRCRRS